MLSREVATSMRGPALGGDGLSVQLPRIARPPQRRSYAAHYVRGKTGTEINFHAALRENPDSPGNPLVNGLKGVNVMHAITHYCRPKGRSVQRL